MLCVYFRRSIATFWNLHIGKHLDFDSGSNKNVSLFLSFVGGNIKELNQVFKSTNPDFIPTVNQEQADSARVPEEERRGKEEGLL